MPSSRPWPSDPKAKLPTGHAQPTPGSAIVIEQRQTAENGETLVALINGHQVTLKRFYVEAAGVRLQPANPEMAPLYLRHEEIEILGIVTGVVRMTA